MLKQYPVKCFHVKSRTGLLSEEVKGLLFFIRDMEGLVSAMKVSVRFKLAQSFVDLLSHLGVVWLERVEEIRIPC